jgi:signal transduction histidine kinase
MLNYLTEIQGYTDFIKMSCPVDSTLQKWIDKIGASSGKINKKINEIRDKAARESGKRNLEETRVDIGKLAEAVVKRHRDYSRWKGIKIDDFIEKDCFVYGDKMVVEDIIDNLVSNAIKFSPHGKTVRVTISKRENLVKIEVKDEGPGFTEEDKANLFKKYKTLSARPTGGELPIGIGLYITRDYVELHKGTIKLESEYGKGALFTVDIPINRK